MTDAREPDQDRRFSRAAREVSWTAIVSAVVASAALAINMVSAGGGIFGNIRADITALRDMANANTNHRHFSEKAYGEWTGRIRQLDSEWKAGVKDLDSEWRDTIKDIEREIRDIERRVSELQASRGK